MKKHLFLSPCLLFCWWSLALQAQNRVAFQPAQLLKSYSLGVSYAKTVSIIFPAGVHSVDLGSEALLADKFTGVENVLRVKANTKGFPETNLSVITRDGRLYSFHVHYQEEPAALSYQMTPADGSGDTKLAADHPARPAAPMYLVAGRDQAPVTFENQDLNQGQLATYSQAIARRRDRVAGIGMRKYKISFDLAGVYIRDNMLFYSIDAHNKSNVNYDIDFIKFYIRDQKRAKRTAVQETEVLPVYVFPADQNTIPGHSVLHRVYCLEKFTIPDQKRLVVEMFEKNGGRVMTFKVRNRDIVRAVLLPELPGT
jgi:conjugative transposon TraN protein